MPEAFAEALATDGLFWLLAAVVAAGLVRGFAGFGSAMIIMPVASSVLTPFAAIAFLTVVEFFGPMPNLPDALRCGNRRDVLRLLIGAVIALPLGLWALGLLPPDVFGWGVSIIVLALLALLMAGWRYGRPLSGAMLSGVGGLGGFLGGVCGLPGPPVIMLYMSSKLSPAVIRANFLLYLLGIDLMMIVGLLWLGRLDAATLVIGGLLIPPYVGANVLGAHLFRPEAEHLFRTIAYVVIAASAILGLPLWT